MLTLVYGYCGSGKTLFLTALGSLVDKKRLITSNYYLNLPNYSEFSVSEFVGGKYNNCLVLLDEAYNYLDNRMSMNMRHRFMSYMLFQSRKKDVEIICSIQLLQTLDTRFRNLADTIVFAKGLSQKGFEYQIMNLQKQQVLSLFLSPKNLLHLFSLYDTKEIIEPIKSENEQFTFMNKDEKNKLLEKIVDEIEAENWKKTTHARIKDFFFRNNYPSYLADMAYSRLQTLRLEEKEIEVKEEKKGKK
jgi:hypothetical protein